MLVKKSPCSILLILLPDMYFGKDDLNILFLASIISSLQLAEQVSGERLIIFQTYCPRLWEKANFPFAFA